MEFKGTKGNWTVSISDEEYNLFQLKEYDYSIKEEEYNAQLISKAPELLEMLQKILLMTETCNGTFEDFRERYNIEIKQLIKEATDI